jgi:hypothetical protein
MMRTLVFFLLATVSANAAEVVRGDEAVVAVKGLTFFRHFGQTHRNRREWNLECDYDHPDKLGHCPPAHHIQPFPEPAVEVQVQQEPQQVLSEQ